MISGPHILLAGDIGGTKTHLAVYSSEKGLQEPLADARLPSQDYPSLGALVGDFARDLPFDFDTASFGVAGPVVRGRASITNLPWTLDEDELEEKLGVSSVHLLNDLAATAQSVPQLGSDDLHSLKLGNAEPHGTIAVVAPGTGLGEAFLTWDGSRYRPHASEGGHTDFAPIDDLEAGLLAHLRERFGRVSYERICSGRWLPSVYEYLKSVGHAPEPEWLSERLRDVDDPVPAIVDAASDNERSCELCRETLKLFVRVLGSEAGNLALKVLATGGVYLGGGMPPRILDFLADKAFIERFETKGRLSPLVQQIPVQVIMNPDAALLGAACHGLEAAGCAIRR
jgi:glucokinase